jgi:LysR family transcriptional regulator, nitrogen assimilation regulatory protein
MNTRGSEAIARVLAELIADLVERGIWRAKLRGEKFNKETLA